MQNKTTSAPDPGAVSSLSSNPLSGVREIADVAREARRILPSPALVEAVCRVADDLFAGRMWNYRPIDLRYHDYLHTLQAGRAYLSLAEAALARSGEFAEPSPRELEIGFAAILLHDTGYLQARGDDEGSGAKYTYCHVLRSCALAASILPTLGFDAVETEDALGCIRCTGLTGNPAKATFSSDGARRVACFVATADYLGQMAAPDYPEKLPALFTEFAEADAFARVPPEKRAFKSIDQLLRATGGFWKGFVLPKLEGDFGGVHRILAGPAPGAPNPYLLAIERNLALIAARSAAAAPAA